MNNIKIISLYGLTNLGLVIICNTGVCYTNQAGGYACMQPSEEGVLAIINDEFGTLLNQLSQRLLNVDGLSNELADEIDKILHNSSSAGFLEVDRCKLQKSIEAWLYVKLRTDQEETIKGFSGAEAVLTWSNSD